MNAAAHRAARLAARRALTALGARWDGLTAARIVIATTPAPKPPRDGAGVLLRHTDADGTWVLLGRRCNRLGGTWANLGGSLDRDEDALAGALRELSEEMLIGASALIGGTIAQVVTTGKSDGGTYTLFVIDVVDAPRLPRRRDLPWEHTDVAWWHESDLHEMDHLHAGFAACWSQVTPVARTLALVP